MPELPEVEVTRRHLAPVLEDAVMVEVEVTHPRTARFNSGPQEVESRLVGRKVERLERTGKFLHAGLDDRQTLVAHLGMSGRFTIDGQDEPHTHFRVELDSGRVVRFIDPRTFGFVAVYEEDALAGSGLGRLGADALANLPDTERLAEALSTRTAPIKALLLDQGIIAGLGNIYADEVLFAAKVHPSREGRALSVEDIERLRHAISDVLVVALENGGTSLDDLAYLLPDGRAGENLGRLRVYGRTDQPCQVCGTPIRSMTIRARTSHFCPSCQVEPR